MNADEKKLIEYVRPPLYYVIVGIIATVIFLIMAVNMPDFETKAICTLFAIGCGGYFGGYYVIRYARMIKKIKAIRNTPDYNILMNDYFNAGRAFKGTLILGDKYIIPKQSGSIYAYDEITRIYQETEYTSGIELSRNFYIYNEKNKKINLCRIMRNDYDRNEMQEIYKYIVSRNNNIKIGVL